MSYTLKLKVYYSSNKDVSIERIAEYIQSIYFPKTLNKAGFHIGETIIDCEGTGFLSSSVMYVTFQDDKDKLLNRLKILKMPKLLKIFKDNIKFDGNEDYMMLYLGYIKDETL